MKKMSLDEFRKYDDSAEVVSAIDPQVISARYATSLYKRLVDVWGEASHSIDIWKEWKKKHKEERKADLEKQLDSLHKICCFIYADPDIAGYAKDTLRIAEWELYDFTLWDNQFRNDEKSVMRWYDQWCYSFNYELL